MQVSNEAERLPQNLPINSQLEIFSCGLLNINHQGKITYANDAMLDILALPAWEVLGQSLISLVGRMLQKKDFLKVWEWLQHIYQPNAYLVTILNGAGETVRLKITVFELGGAGWILIADRYERPGYTSQVIDLIIEQLPIPVISIDSQGRIHMLNQACEHLTQRRGADLWGHSIEDLEKSFPGLPSILLQTLYDMKPIRASIKFQRPGRKPANLRLDTRPIVVWGQVKGAVAYLFATDGREAGQRRGFRSQHFNIVSDLVEETAHKVRNPLTVVKGFIQLYKDDPENIPWDLLLDEVSGIEKTIQDFMMFSQNYREKTERVNFNQIIAEVYPEIEKAACPRGVWIELYLDKSLVSINADAERIKTLLLHLTTNSLYAMPSGGILTIRTTSDQEQVILQIADSGVGMSEELLEKVFKPFFSTWGDNSGLGLTYCEHVVDSLGGNISVSSKECEGTVVTVTIPRVSL